MNNKQATRRAVLHAFIASVFLRARTLPAFVRYWQRQLLVPRLGPVGAGQSERISANDAVTAFHIAIDIVTGTLCDIELVGQESALPMASDTESRPFNLVRFCFSITSDSHDAVLTVDDEFISNKRFWADQPASAPVPAVVGLLTMTARPLEYWHLIGNLGMAGNIGASRLRDLDTTHLAALISPGALGILFCHHVFEQFFEHLPSVGTVNRKRRNTAMDDRTLRQIVALAQEMAPSVSAGGIHFAEWIPTEEREMLTTELYQVLLKCELLSDVPVFLHAMQQLRHRALMHCYTKYEEQRLKAVAEGTLPLRGQPARVDVLWDAVKG